MNVKEYLLTVLVIALWSAMVACLVHVIMRLLAFLHLPAWTALAVAIFGGAALIVHSAHSKR